MKEEITIRKYTKADKPELNRMLVDFKKFINSIDRYGTEGMKPGYEKKITPRISKMLSEDHGQIFMAETQGKRPVGYVSVIMHTPSKLEALGDKRGTKKGEIFDLYVDKKYRGKGVGAKLMLAAESHLKKNGCTHIKIGVFWPNTHARKFYERFGYELYDVIYIKKVR